MVRSSAQCGRKRADEGGGSSDSRQEKPARATLLSAVQRSLNRDTIVIVDAMNYIKGSRYQMYLTARELSCRVCTVSSTWTTLCSSRADELRVRFSLLLHRNSAASGIRGDQQTRLTSSRRESLSSQLEDED
jgi:hypothetical protein